ncbi:DUF3352 domain-containing protein [Chloroflexus sp.]|uniref:DUF3352 domain-containing protein n=1 Tax=Chloroflexus sp. TaxID=1904827 RepID=UPI00298F3D73|nr:DUF3352 domain-containing protein [Chloroflexus sp.]MCX7859333.1 DUF3352 domain-containing protein [Chloroflexus sp.]MDW8404866.1 DUF3352 domain-containing protein [Chloroflexus sp.]
MIKTSTIPRERGLGYAFIGGLAITFIAALLGALFIYWFTTVQRGPTPAELLPADVQLYASLSPTLSDVPEQPRIERALSEVFGLSMPADAATNVAALLGVKLDSDVITWIGSDIAIVVRDFTPVTRDVATDLITNGEVLVFLASRNDPQAKIFLEKHLAVRRNRGETFSAQQAGEATIYVGEIASPLRAVGLIEHYIVFSNRPEALIDLAAGPDRPNRLAGVPDFQQFRETIAAVRSGAIYTDGSPAAEAARAAVRAWLARVLAP